MTADEFDRLFRSRDRERMLVGFCNGIRVLVRQAWDRDPEVNNPALRKLEAIIRIFSEA
jgi:hypothetical protein